jgi:hypothetical protein
MRLVKITPKSKVIQIRVTEEVYGKFEAIAVEKDISISYLGRQLIEVFLE